MEVELDSDVIWFCGLWICDLELWLAWVWVADLWFHIVIGVGLGCGFVIWNCDRHGWWGQWQGCETNLVAAGWWVVGLGHSGSWCSGSAWWVCFCGGLPWWVCVFVCVLLAGVMGLLLYLSSFFSPIWILRLSSFFPPIWVLWLWWWLFCDLEEEGGWAFFFPLWWILVATVEIDVGSAVVKVVVTIAIGFCGGCFYIILNYCIYYFKWSGKKIELLMYSVL